MQIHVGKKDEVLRALDVAIDTAIAALEAQTDSDWEQVYSAVGVDDVNNRFGITCDAQCIFTITLDR